MPLKKNAPVYTARSSRRRKRRRRTALLRLLLCAGVLAALLCAAYTMGESISGGAVPEAQAASPLPRYTGSAPFTVAVDAGHGGSDTGAVGVLNECDMTAATGRALTALLEADPSFNPVGTRADYDTTAKPSERAAEASRQGAQLLIAIHGNSDGTGTASGFECFPLVPGRAQHENSLYFAGLLADGMQGAGSALRGGNGIRYAYYDADDVKTIVDSSDGSVHKKETTFTILEQAGCPAVLAEQCFVTNAADVDAFGDEDGCAAAALVYYHAVCAYFDTEPQQ